MNHNVNMSLVSNVWIKQISLPKCGDLVLTHQHRFDHQTLLAHGSLRAYVDDEHVRDFHAPAIVVVRSGQNHCFQALTDDTVLYCVHALRDDAEDIIDPDSEVSGHLDTLAPVVYGETNSTVFNMEGTVA